MVLEETRLTPEKEEVIKRNEQQDEAESQIETSKEAMEIDEGGDGDGDKWEDVLGSGGILKKVIRKGKSDTRPQKFHICRINYVCKLENGDEVERESDFVMQVDGCDVVQGLDLSISMMQVGEKCELKIEPRLAFGTKGLPPLIPPNANIIYEVELLSIVEEDTENLSVSERKERGNKKRTRGNWWYGRGENTLAIQCYRRALDYLDELEGGMKHPNSKTDNEITDYDLQNLLEDRISVCNNMAAAQIKLALYDQALNSLEVVLKCQPQNVKALYRKAKVYKAKNELSTALKYLQKANEASPEDEDILKEMTALSALIKKQKVSEKELAQRMFNLKDDKYKKFGKNNKSKFQLWTVVGVSVMVTIASIAAYKLKYM